MNPLGPQPILFIRMIPILAILIMFHPPASSAEEPREAVVLLHGLGRTDRAMAPLEARLSEAGFVVHNLRYPSTGGDPRALVRIVRSSVDACCSDAPVVHYVGHSLGGILVRAMLAEERPENLGRVVLLAPPNHGSEWVDILGKSPLFDWCLGPAAAHLGTGEKSFPLALPTPDYEIGVIAGTRSVNPLGSILLPNPNDGTVSVESTRLEGMTDFRTVPNSHTFIMRSSEVAGEVALFLRTGRFAASETR